jgi:hypothetical protein
MTPLRSHLLANALAGALPVFALPVFALLVFAAGPLAAADDPAVVAADSAFVQATVKANPGVLGKLLDTNFQWIDANGNLAGRPQTLAHIPEPAIRTSNPQVRRHNYGQLEVIEADSGRAHVLRVWVKQPAGWRLLVYQEVRSLDAPPKVTPSSGADCVNPCKSVLFVPKTDAERAVMTAFQNLETSAMSHDAPKFDTLTAEEFIAATSNSDKLVDKPTRMAELRASNMRGLAPTPLVSARMVQFGDAMVMRSQHLPPGGRPLEATRVFVRRGGKWVESLSYQTAIQSRTPVA